MITAKDIRDSWTTISISEEALDDWIKEYINPQLKSGVSTYIMIGNSKIPWSYHLFHSEMTKRGFTVCNDSRADSSFEKLIYIGV